MCWSLIFLANAMLVQIHDKYATNPPRNLSILYVGSIQATLCWLIDTREEIVRFELTYEIADVTFGIHRVTTGVDRKYRCITIRGLAPQIRYRAFMVSIGTTTDSNRSNEVEFTTQADDLLLYSGSRSIQPEELVIISLVVVMWIIAVVVFIQKWNSIRILQPVEPRYKTSFKNLDTIKVCKKPQDSVIYKNYSRKLSLTMEEREKKRFERMHTLERINTLPAIMMEEVTTDL